MSLFDIGIGDEGAAAIGEVLKVNTTITEINLEGTPTVLRMKILTSVPHRPFPPFQNITAT